MSDARVADVSSLINQSVAGDEAALRQLLFIYHGRLIAVVTPMIGDKLRSTITADDVLQETFVAAFRDIRTFRAADGQSFFAWLRTIATNQLRDMARSHNCKKRGGDRVRVEGVKTPESSALDLLVEISDGGVSPSGVAARDEAVEAMRIAIAALPEDQRDAIRLHCLDGLSLDETARIMDRTWDSVRGLIQRGKRALRSSMQQSSLWLSRK